MPLYIIGWANIICMLVGFIFIGFLTKENRFQHGFYVAVGLWLTSLVNILIMGTSFGMWLLGGILTLILMFIGVGISHIFIKTFKQEDSQ